MDGNTATVWLAGLIIAAIVLVKLLDVIKEIRVSYHLSRSQADLAQVENDSIDRHESGGM